MLRIRPAAINQTLLWIYWTKDAHRSRGFYSTNELKPHACVLGNVLTLHTKIEKLKDSGFAHFTSLLAYIVFELGYLQFTSQRHETLFNLQFTSQRHETFFLTCSSTASSRQTLCYQFHAVFVSYIQIDVIVTHTRSKPKICTSRS